MAKKGNPDPQLSKADRLIQEAVAALEKAEEEKEKTEAKSEAKGGASQEIAPVSDEGNRTTGPIARIDIQQYVEREAYLRLAAEFENFRKRAFKERSEAERGGREKILRGFLEIFDNLERGLSQAKEETALAQGITMILSQAENWLKSEGLQRIETSGIAFDPTVHEAVAQEERSDLPANSIIREVKRGYRWTDRLLRPASVVVSRVPDQRNQQKNNSSSTSNSETERAD